MAVKNEDPNQCSYCDETGGKKTVANQVCMPINGRVRCIDYCIHPIVAALNAAGIYTTHSCCGHTKTKGSIELKDGRVLIILPKAPESMTAWKKEIKL